MVNCRRFITKIFTKFPAPICFVTGRMGKGKTDFSLLIAQILLEENAIKMIGTNIKADYPYFDYITNVYQLKQWMLRKGDKLFILDEAGIYADARNALSKVNKELRKIAFLLRKFDGKLIFVTQTFEDLDSTFRNTDIWLATFKKLSLQTCDVYSSLWIGSKRLTKIPPTSVPFKTKDIAEFSFEPSFDSETLEDQLLTEWLECQNFSKVAKAHSMFPMQVKRIVIERIKQLRFSAI